MLLPDSLGARLRAQRLSRKVSIASIAESTKILGALLEALEHDDVSRWPSGLYRRAFIRAYATAIGLESGAGRPRVPRALSRPRRGARACTRSGARRSGAAVAALGSASDARRPRLAFAPEGIFRRGPPALLGGGLRRVRPERRLTGDVPGHWRVLGAACRGGRTLLLRQHPGARQHARRAAVCTKASPRRDDPPPDRWSGRSCWPPARHPPSPQPEAANGRAPDALVRFPPRAPRSANPMSRDPFADGLFPVCVAITGIRRLFDRRRC